MKTGNKLKNFTQGQARQYLDQRNDKIQGGLFWRQLDFFAGLVMVVLLALCLRAVIGEPADVRGSSMEDTLQEGDYILLDKLSYIFSPMERGDVVICYYPGTWDHTCVKRVIGLPGEQVDIINGQVYINGEALKEGYLTRVPRNNHDGSWVVEEGTVFVLGDNRLVSKDSTHPEVGCIPQEKVLGRVRCRILPLSQIRTFGHWAY